MFLRWRSLQRSNEDIFESRSMDATKGLSADYAKDRLGSDIQTKESKVTKTEECRPRND